MPKIVFVREKKDVEVQAGVNLRTAAQAAEGVEVHGKIERLLNCRGFGLCGTCKVLVKSGMENLSPVGPVERLHFRLHPLDMFSILGHENEMRLACQATVNGDCSVETLPTFNWSGENFWQKPYPNK